MRRHVRIVRFGHSYLFVRMSRAAAAHSSPRRKLGCVASFGWLEKRADTAHTERTSTGGKAPALWFHALAKVQRVNFAQVLPQFPHITRLMKNVICLSIQILEEHLGQMLLNLFRRKRIASLEQEFTLLGFLD